MAEWRSDASRGRYTRQRYRGYLGWPIAWLRRCESLWLNVPCHITHGNSARLEYVHSASKLGFILAVPQHLSISSVGGQRHAFRTQRDIAYRGGPSPYLPGVAKTNRAMKAMLMK
jgi:hypothetical protein